MNSGHLIERVTFASPTEAPDGHGGVINGWTDRFTCRAAFRYLRGGEAVQASRLRGRQPVVVTIRQSQAALAIGPDWRMTDTRRNVVYNLRSIVPSDDRLFLEITAESGVEV